MLKRYQGSCHCGKVAFAAAIDLAAGTGKCNCSICTKRREWSVLIKPDAFTLLRGAEAMSDYQFNTMSGHHRFCATCGCAPFGEGYVEEIGGAFVSIALASLDEVDPAELAEAPVRYMDGRHDNWFEEPAETRHL